MTSRHGMAAEQNSFSAIFLSLFFNILRGAFGMRSRKHGRCQLWYIFIYTQQQHISTCDHYLPDVIIYLVLVVVWYLLPYTHNTQGDGPNSWWCVYILFFKQFQTCLSFIYLSFQTLAKDLSFFFLSDIVFCCQFNVSIRNARRETIGGNNRIRKKENTVGVKSPRDWPNTIRPMYRSSSCLWIANDSVLIYIHIVYIKYTE